MARLGALVFLLGLSLGHASTSAALQKMLDTLQEQISSNTIVTPEVKQKFDKMAETVENKIIPAIKADFTATQIDLDRLVADLGEDSNNLQLKKPDVDAKHKSVYDCFTVTRELQCKYEVCKASAGEKCARKTKECDEVKPIYEWSIDDENFGPKTCDLDEAATYEHCPPLNHLSVQTIEEGEKIEDNYENVFVIQRDECIDWTNQCENQTTECTRQLGILSSKKTNCVIEQNAAEIAMCTWGLGLQDKCVEYQEYLEREAHTKETKSTAHSWSEVDRQNEFHATKSIKCWLDNYLADETKFDLEAKDACIKAIDYSTDIGDLDLKSQEVAGYMAVEQMTCQDKFTIFHPKEIVGTGPEAQCEGGYIEQDAKFAVSYTGSPYAFCPGA